MKDHPLLHIINEIKKDIKMGHIVALFVDYDKKEFSITCRDLKAGKTTDWKFLKGNKIKNMAGKRKLNFSLLFDGNKTKATLYSMNLTDIYERMGYSRINVNS